MSGRYFSFLRRVNVNTYLCKITREKMISLLAGVGKMQKEFKIRPTVKAGRLSKAAARDYRENSPKGDQQAEVNLWGVKPSVQGRKLGSALESQHGPRRCPASWCCWSRGFSWNTHEQESFGWIKMPDGNEPLVKATASLGEGKRSIIGHKRRQSPGLGLDSAGHLKAFDHVGGWQKHRREKTDSFSRISLQLEKKK